MKLVAQISSFVGRSLALCLTRRRKQARVWSMEGLESRIVLDGTSLADYAAQMMPAISTTDTTSAAPAPAPSSTPTSTMGPTQNDVTNAANTTTNAPTSPTTTPMTTATSNSVTLSVMVDFRANGSQVITATVSGLASGTQASLTLGGTFQGNSIQITGDGSYQFNFNPALYGIGSAEVIKSDGTVLATTAFYAF